jgi:hypothetical protein
MRGALIAFLSLMLISLASADCSLEVSLLNQDPYPAVPGDYVKIVFQVSGLSSPKCNNVDFWIDNSYPFTLDPGVENKISLNSGTYIQDYSDVILIPYKLRVDKEALDGNNEIRAFYSILEGQSIIYTRKFNISVEESKTDFEVFIKDYVEDTDKITLAILNTGKKDASAVTVEIPDQENIQIIKTDKVILGDLDSKEDDTVAFEATPSKGNINLSIYYNDEGDERRKVDKTVLFNPDLFPKVEKKQKVSPTLAFIIGLLIPIIFFYARGKIRKRRERLMKKRGMVKF